MNWKHGVRGLLHHVGLDLVRYPLHDPLERTVRLLAHYGVDCVIDIGANDGGFAREIRRLGYAGRVVSFEPLSAPFQRLERASNADPLWEARRNAVGAHAARVRMHVAGNAGQSSSVLPMLDAHVAVAPEARYVAEEEVEQVRLDDAFSLADTCDGSRVFLKIDVQGYENAVLDGAAGLLASPLVVGLQLELSLTPLYEGSMTYREGLDRAEALGMELMGVAPVLSDPDTGRLLQIDGVFFRPTSQ